MSKIFKILVIGGGVVIIVVVAAIWLLIANLDRLLKHAVETVGTEVTGTQVSLDQATVSLQSAEGSLDGLTIANPQGFESPFAFELQRVQLGIDPSTVRSEVIVVREVLVEGAHLTFEQLGDKNNLQTILDNMEAGDEPAADDGSAETKMVIENFRFTGGQVTLIVEQLGEEITLPLSEVVLTGVGRMGTGETVSSVARQLLEPILEQTMNAAKQEARDQLEQRARDELDKQKDKAADKLKDRLLN